MNGIVTTVLDVLGLLAVAAGLGLALGLVYPPAGLVAFGLLVLAGSWLADRPARRRG